MSRSLSQSLGIFVVVFFTHALSPNATPFDSRWSVFTAHSLIHEDNADLNEFRPYLVRDDFYAIECVASDYRRTYPVDASTPCERYYNFYPIAVPTLAIPFVFVLDSTLDALQPWLRASAERMNNPGRRALLSGDIVGASMMVELIIASMVIALASVFVYLVALELLPPNRAIITALLFAFCTSAWSTGSRALWQHGFSMLFIALALWLALVARRRPEVIALAGAPLMLAAFVRPTNIVPLACFNVFVWLIHRRQFVRFICWAAPVVLGFCIASYVTYGTLLAPYAFAKRANAPGLGIHPQLAEAFVGNLISPGRGLLIFTPVFIFCLYGIVRKSSDPYIRALKWMCVATIGLHWTLIALYEDWWGGHSFGPRYFSDLTPIFVYLLIPSIAVLVRPGHGRLTSAFVFLAAVSFFIHLRGATAWATMEWNAKPVNIRDDPGRIWRWSDLQFLRGLPKPTPPRMTK